MYRPPPGTYHIPYSGGSPVNGPPQGPPFNQNSPNMAWQRPPPPGAMPPPPMSVAPIWKEHTTPEGRKYWFNNMTKTSTWEKPEELMAPEEKVLKESSWREYSTPEGKKYYSNIKTKETVWEIPPELREQLEKAKALAAEIEKMKSAPVVPPPMAPPPQEHVRPVMNMPSLSQSFQQAQAIPEFATKEQAEEAFFGLLKETGVKSDWNWEQAQRAIITKPLYRALKTISERKEAFHIYVAQEARREREEREEREQQQKAAFISMLEKQPEIKPFTRFRTLVKMCGHLPAFTDLPSERQCEIYFDEYIQNMQREEKDRLRELRKTNMEKFSKLLHSISEITYKTSWKEVQSLYHNFIPDAETQFQGMDMLDFLSVFEEYNRLLWEEPINEINEKIHQRRRKERKSREGFKALLHELVANHQINVRTLWKEIYPLIKDDSRYINAVGLPDSTPLDMFWDLLDDLDEQLYHQKKVIYDALNQANFQVDLETSLEDYLNALYTVDERIKQEINHENLKFIYEHLQYKVHQRIKDEKRRQEKKLRKKLDIFRHALKHGLQPPITVEDTWDIIKSRAEEQLIEYKEIEDESLKEEVFNKFIHRLKEKKEDEEEEEEGMIKEDEEGMFREDEEMHHHDKRRHHSSRRSRRKDYDGGSDSEEERIRKRRKQRHGASKGYSSAEEGEALDDYMKRS